MTLELRINRLKRDAPELLPQIRYNRDIISFRNILVHGTTPSTIG